ncbi:uncharacterized protein [Aegilops tauschii subsp. strangulata]|uniref:uncharacterized protein n=1 Tax=Aegilops tauschii subsp. strangulata TaxID=200361 RepID=UPI003CC8D809
MRLVKQKARRQSTEKQAFIIQETRKLQDAGVIREVRYPEWLANQVIVPKKGGKECMVYCYTCMPFGLRNAGATFQWLMHIALDQQLRRNAEAYVDDRVVKSREAKTLIEDLEEMFASLRKVDLRLNPEKEMQKLAGCMTSLGRFISKLGEHALPFFKLMKRKGPFEWTPKADAAFQDLKRYLTSPPVMVASRPLEPLVLYLAATPHSASAALLALREESPIKDPQQVAQSPSEAQQPRDGASEASADPTANIPPEAQANPPARGDPEAKAHEVAADAASDETPEGQHPQETQDLTNTSSLVEHPVYFVSMGHPIKVVLAYPLERVLQSPNAAGRVAEWNIELQVFQLEFSTTRVIKGMALADFVAEWTDVPDRGICEDRSLSPGDEAPDGWIMYFDGAFTRQGAGAGAVLISPAKYNLFYAVQLCFQQGEKVSNNIAEYEGLLAGLRAAEALGVKRHTIRDDSQLHINFSNKEYTPKDEHMEAYLEGVRKMEKRFLGLELQHVPRGTNKEADDIAKRASRRLPQELGVFEERLFKPSTAPPIAAPAPPQEDLPRAPATGAPACGPTSGIRPLLALEPREGCWTEEFKTYLLHGTLPEKEEDAEHVARQATAYCIRDGELEQGLELLADIHGGDCGHHSSSRTLVGKAFCSGFYWPTALNDATELVRSCEACQFHAKQIHQPTQGLQTIPLTWSFAV